RGHALEVRVCAEDPAAGFFPSAGQGVLLRGPGGPGGRVDSGVETGTRGPLEYDSLLAKISASGPEPAPARPRLPCAPRDTVILGPTCNVAFLQDVLAHPAFLSGSTHTGFLEQHLAAWQPDEHEIDAAAVAAALAAPGRSRPSGDAPASPRSTPWDTL